MSDKKPAARIKLYPLSASIWRNPTQNGCFYTVQFTKSFKDSDDNWKRTDIFAGNELLLLAKLADLAESEIRKLRDNDHNTDASYEPE